MKFLLKEVKNTIIGIDPDCKKNGVCVFNNKTFALQSLTRHEVLELVKSHPNCLVILENPSANKPTFYRKGQNQKAMLRISQNIGAVKAVANILFEDLQVFEKQKIIEKVMHVSPLTNYFKNWKKDTALFVKDTGILRSNADTRDACALVYNFLAK